MSGGGNDLAAVLSGDLSVITSIKDEVNEFGDKLAARSGLVISITPPWHIPKIVNQMLSYDDGITIYYSEFCREMGRDGVHPSPECIQQMHQKIIEIINAYECVRDGDGITCECKDG